MPILLGRESAENAADYEQRTQAFRKYRVAERKQRRAAIKKAGTHARTVRSRTLKSGVYQRAFEKTVKNPSAQRNLKFSDKSPRKTWAKNLLKRVSQARDLPKSWEKSKRLPKTGGTQLSLPLKTKGKSVYPSKPQRKKFLKGALKNLFKRTHLKGIAAEKADANYTYYQGMFGRGGYHRYEGEQLKQKQKYGARPYREKLKATKRGANVGSVPSSSIITKGGIYVSKPGGRIKGLRNKVAHLLRGMRSRLGTQGARNLLVKHGETLPAGAKDYLREKRFAGQKSLRKEIVSADPTAYISGYGRREQRSTGSSGSWPNPGHSAGRRRLAAQLREVRSTTKPASSERMGKLRELLSSVKSRVHHEANLGRVRQYDSSRYGNKTAPKTRKLMDWYRSRGGEALQGGLNPRAKKAALATLRADEFANVGEDIATKLHARQQLSGHLRDLMKRKGVRGTKAFLLRLRRSTERARQV